MPMRRVVISALVLTLAGTFGLVGGAAAAPSGTPPVPASAPSAQGVEKILPFQHQWQQTGYWCGPAATRVAISARTSNPPSQAALAAQLGTHTGGTDHISQVSSVLRANLGVPYEYREMPNDPPTQWQRDQLWRDIIADIDAGFAVVANIVAPPGNQPPGYPSNQTVYHYIAVVGYDTNYNTVLIADSAQFSLGVYWLNFSQLATLIPPKGYAF
ncbi:C39 family peptidase [Actinophytocola glycyrrhizae]|uniref:C39 family peptidase n=1 Tax=Actinophytocola glycyrrhizae TaxID=2044873 RepID=A0ABV9RUT6_9PSEU